jgi:hypothetical protein
MNLVVAAIQKILPGPSRGSEVGAIVASVPKPPAMIQAESALLEIAATHPSLAKRRSVIFEILNVQSPTRTVFKPEEDALQAEQADIDRRVTELNARAAELRREIDSAMPAYAQAIAVALGGFRHRAAETLLDSIVALDKAIADISETAKMLSAVGISVSSASSLGYGKTYKKLAEKILAEKVRHG